MPELYDLDDPGSGSGPAEAAAGQESKGQKNSGLIIRPDEDKPRKRAQKKVDPAVERRRNTLLGVVLAALTIAALAFIGIQVLARKPETPPAPLVAGPGPSAARAASSARKPPPPSAAPVLPGRQRDPLREMQGFSGAQEREPPSPEGIH